MKKLLSILICAAILTGVSACGSAPEPTAPVSAEPPMEAVYINDYSIVLDTLREVTSTSGAGRYYAGVKGASVETTAAEAPVPDMAEPAADAVAAGAPAADYSGTNVQVQGIDEGDIVKTDGEYIYVISGDELVIFSAAGPDTTELSRIAVGYSSSVEDKDYWSNEGKSPIELYVWEDTVAVVLSQYYVKDYVDAQGIWHGESGNTTTVDVYDVTDRAAPALLGSAGQDGGQTASRMIDGKVYLISTYYVYDYDEGDPDTYIPCVYTNGARERIAVSDICIMPMPSGAAYSVIGVYDMQTAAITATLTALGAGETVYMNADALYIADSTWDESESEPYTASVYTVTDYECRSYTDINRFSLSEGDVQPSGSVRVKGYMDGQFAMDEYGGSLRVVTTTDGYDYKIYKDEEMGFENYVSGEDFPSATSLYIFDSASMSALGSVEGLAQGERVYSVRFDGDWAYFCTYESVDPLFAVDVSDPASPVVMSELKISGFSEYLHVWSEGLLFGLGQETVEQTSGENTWMTTDGMKLVMFDTSDKADVSVKSVLNISEDWSEALYNHKAILIDSGKNLIGFPSGDGYDVYGWTAERGFFLRAHIETGEDDWGWGIRGLYSGAYAYVVSDSSITVIDMESFILSASVVY